MPLFSSSVNNNVLVAIEYVKVLARADVAMETVLKELGQQPLGRVSQCSKKVLDGVVKGSSLEQSFDSVAAGIGHKNLERFLLILKEGDVIRRLGELSDKVMKERQLRTESFVESLASGLGRVMILMTVPIVLFFIPIFERAMEGTGDVLPQIIIPTVVPAAVIGIDLALLLFALTRLRYSE